MKKNTPKACSQFDLPFQTRKKKTKLATFSKLAKALGLPCVRECTM